MRRIPCIKLVFGVSKCFPPLVSPAGPMDPREPQAPPQAAESVVSEVYAGAAGQLQLGGFGDSKLLHIPNNPRKERDQESTPYAAGANLFVPVAAEKPEKTTNFGRDSVFEKPQSEVVVSTLPRPGHHGQETGTVVSSLRPNQAQVRPAPVPLAIPEHSSAPVSYNIPVVHPVRQPQLHFHQARPPPPPIVEAVTRPSPQHVFGSFEEVESSYDSPPIRHGGESEHTSREVDYAPTAEAPPSPPPSPPRPTLHRPQDTSQWGSLHSFEDIRAAVEPPISFASAQSQSSAEASSQEAFPWQDEYDYEYVYEEVYEDDSGEDNDVSSSPQALQEPISVKSTHLNPDTLFGFTVPAQPQPSPPPPPSPSAPPPSRPPRPSKPFVGSAGLPERAGSGQPRTRPPKKAKRPKKASPSRASKLSPKPKKNYYDPFSFQQSGEGKPRKGRQHPSVTAADLDDSFPDDLTVSQQRRVPSVTVGRQISNSFGGGNVGRFSNVIDDAPVLHEDRQRLDHNGKPVKRNMLMNIILRPGGGNKKKALPRPKVDVKAEGANVIVIKMTFPDNENIQGLRAFTPTDPRELDQFADLDDLVPVGSSISKVTAEVPRDKFYFDAQSGQIRDGHI